MSVPLIHVKTAGHVLLMEAVVINVDVKEDTQVQHVKVRCNNVFYRTSKTSDVIIG